MEHETNTFDERGTAFAEALLLYGFAILVLAALLLCAAFEKDISSILRNLDCGVSILLKVAVSCFLFEAAGFLRRYQKQSLRRSAEKRDNATKSAVSAAAESFDDSMNSGWVQMTYESRARQDEEAKPPDSFPRTNIPTTKESVCGQIEKRIPAQQRIYLDFQDTRRALDILDGRRQGPIFLVPASKGSLTGCKNKEGSCLVLPYEEYLTETELRYSPVTACFEITGLTHVRQKVKVHCERPAILTETRDGLYEIAKKGQLTVVSVIE